MIEVGSTWLCVHEEELDNATVAGIHLGYIEFTEVEAVMAFTAPAPGIDPKLDRIVDEAWKVMEKGEIKGVDKTKLREVLALRLAQVNGEKVEETVEATPAKKPAPTVDITKAAGKLTVKKPTSEPYWYDKAEDARLLDHFVELSTAGLVQGGLLITGPAGSGKTESVVRSAQRLGRRFLKMDAATVTDPEVWIGRRDIDAQGTKFVLSDFLAAVRDGTLMLIDEVNRLHPVVLNIIMPLLDGSRALHIAGVNETIEVSPQTVFVGTANIGVQFGGTHRMDWAFRERFPYTIERDFPPEAEEIKVLTTATNVDAKSAKWLVGIGAKTRQMWRTGDLKAPISTRLLKNASVLVAQGHSLKAAMSYTVEPLYDPDSNGVSGGQSERAMVRGLIEGKTARA